MAARCACGGFLPTTISHGEKMQIFSLALLIPQAGRFLPLARVAFMII